MEHTYLYMCIGGNVQNYIRELLHVSVRIRASHIKNAWFLRMVRASLFSYYILNKILRPIWVYSLKEGKKLTGILIWMEKNQP